MLAATSHPKRLCNGDMHSPGFELLRAACMHILSRSAYPSLSLAAPSRWPSRPEARAQTPPTGASVVLPAVTVTAPADLEKQPTDAASEQRISGETLNTRPGHAAGRDARGGAGPDRHPALGRGQGEPVFPARLQPRPRHRHRASGWTACRSTCARTRHGQGYADLNFLIPELVDSVLLRKGPYWAQEGDFSSAGALHIAYADRLEKNLAVGDRRQLRLLARAGGRLDRRSARAR